MRRVRDGRGGAVASLVLTVAGIGISADVLTSEATASCDVTGASASGSSVITHLVINGLTIHVTGAPNQTIYLPLGLGKVVINEQIRSITSNSADMIVNALHVTVLGGVTDVVISSSHAGMTCGNNGCVFSSSMASGSGVTAATATGSVAEIGVAGGLTQTGEPWGHLSFVEHGENGLRVRGVSVTAFEALNRNARRIEGEAEVNGEPGFTYSIDLMGNQFLLRLSNGYLNAGVLASGRFRTPRVHTLDLPCFAH